MFIDFGAANAHVSFLYSFLEIHNSEACERVSENPPEFINFLSFTLLNVLSVRNFVISRSTTGRPYLMMFLLLPHICWLFTLTFNPGHFGLPNCRIYLWSLPSSNRHWPRATHSLPLSFRTLNDTDMQGQLCDSDWEIVLGRWQAERKPQLCALPLVECAFSSIINYD